MANFARTGTVGARAPANSGWAERIRAELVGNILPFWPEHAIDRARGGFFGTIASDRSVEKDSPRSCVVNARILWTYAAAARLIGPAWRETADWAFDYVADKFWDGAHGGVFWTLDADGHPIADRKQTYAQAFGIYAFAEYFRLTQNPKSLDLAKRLYDLMEEHCRDTVRKGYWEARGRAWQPLEDMRLSDKDLNCPKSMNTHLHVLEAYTNLLRVWPDEGLKARQHELLGVMLEHVVDPGTGHFKMFFDEAWTSLSGHVSFGHDIEGSWLLVEAADVLGDADLLRWARAGAVLLANAAAEGLDDDGSLLFEADAKGRLIDDRKHWWVQAEAVVGFYNAWQLTGEAFFREASREAWDYIESRVVDREHGEWYAKLTRQGVPLTEADDPEAHLAGPWKCPYHNARVCFEMLSRLRETRTQ
jgi:mannobiose 2-epimerase